MRTNSSHNRNNIATQTQHDLICVLSRNVGSFCMGYMFAVVYGYRGLWLHFVFTAKVVDGLWLHCLFTATVVYGYGVYGYGGSCYGVTVWLRSLFLFASVRENFMRHRKLSSTSCL